MKHEKGMYIKIEITLPSVKWNPADVAAHCNCCLFPVTLIKLHCPCSKCRNQRLPIGHSMGQLAPALKWLCAPPACPGNGIDTQYTLMTYKTNRLCSVGEAQCLPSPRRSSPGPRFFGGVKFPGSGGQITPCRLRRLPWLSRELFCTF